MAKLYAYFDESGIGSLPFSVGAVVVTTDPNAIRDICEQIEIDSGKGLSKWNKARYANRLAYMRAVLKHEQLTGTLCFATFDQVQNYETATIESIVRVVNWALPNKDKKLSLYVDALSKPKCKEYAPKIRRGAGIFLDGLQGVARDESHPLIRLADAVAGFVQDARAEDNEEINALFAHALQHGQLMAV